MRRRRALIGLAGLALGAVGVRLPLERLKEAVERWSMDGPETRATMVAALEHEYVAADRRADFGERLFLEASAARRLTVTLANPTLDHYRVAARLSLIFGLHLAGEGNIPAGHTWCAQAADLASRSKDPETEAHVRGWAAARGIYEGWSIGQAMAAAERTLQLSPGPTLGALNAHAAKVHAAGLTGQLDDGRRAVHAMDEVAQMMGDWAASARTALFALYLEARVGDPGAAGRVHSLADELTRGTAWWHDTVTYGAMGQVRAGDVDGGIRMALDCARSAGSRSHLHTVGLADLLRAIQAERPGYRSDELTELRQHVPVTTARPWETVRP